MKNNVQDLRYRIGDMLGDYAPDSFRRRGPTAEWMIGLAGILAAAGISYLAMRMADRRLTDLIRRIVPDFVAPKGGDRRAVHGMEGGRTPEAARPGTFSRREREARQRSDDAETSERQGQTSGNRH